MADLNETVAAVDEFDAWVQGIYQLEQEDLVLGGADGIDNLQAKQLLARSNWLKAQVLGLGAGKQPLDAMLTALSSLVTEADQTLYFTGPDAPALTALTAYARTLIAAADAAAARATLGAASPADIAAAIAALVNSSPATLDTLNELATALGNDADFATTITNALALKAPWAALDPVITEAGITVDHGVATQLKDAILSLIALSGFLTQASADARYIGIGYMLIRDEKSSNTNGGASVNGVQTRTLNTVVSNTISGASLSANQITLPAGTYRVRARAPSIGVNYSQALLYNVTDMSIIARGTSENGSSNSFSDPFTTTSFVETRFTLAASKIIELRHYTGEIHANGLGAAVSQGTEVYSSVEIIKEA